MKQTLEYKKEQATSSVRCFKKDMHKIQHSSILRKMAILAVVAMLTFSNQSCKSSKKAKAAQQAEQARLAKEKEERLKREEGERRRKQEEDDRAKNDPAKKVESYFQAISSAGSVESANAKIDEALGLFSSPDVPVLIIIKRTGDVVDYDKPTTIKAYLNYLKDQKKTFNKIDKIDYDADGKIRELNLITK